MCRDGSHSPDGYTLAYNGTGTNHHVKEGLNEMKKSVRIVLAVLVLGIALMTTGCLGNPGLNLVGTWSGTYNGGAVLLKILPNPIVKDLLVLKGYGYQAELTVTADFDSNGSTETATYLFNATPQQYNTAIQDALEAAINGSEMTPPDFPVFVWGELGVYDNIFQNKVIFYHSGDGTALLPLIGGEGTFEAATGFHLTIGDQTVDLTPSLQ